MNYTRDLIHITPTEDIVNNIATILEYTVETASPEKRVECGNVVVNALLSVFIMIKFILYTGEYPNLCSGMLVLEIDGNIHYFRERYVMNFFLRRYEEIRNNIRLGIELDFREEEFAETYIADKDNNFYIENLKYLISKNELVAGLNLFPVFWESGGHITDEYEAVQGRWKVDYDKLSDVHKPYYKELDNLFNSNVEYGCCGGCI